MALEQQVWRVVVQARSCWMAGARAREIGIGGRAWAIWSGVKFVLANGGVRFLRGGERRVDWEDGVHFGICRVV